MMRLEYMFKLYQLSYQEGFVNKDLHDKSRGPQKLINVHSTNLRESSLTSYNFCMSTLILKVDMTIFVIGSC